MHKVDKSIGDSSDTALQFYGNDENKSTDEEDNVFVSTTDAPDGVSSDGDEKDVSKTKLKTNSKKKSFEKTHQKINSIDSDESTDPLTTTAAVATASYSASHAVPVTSIVEHSSNGGQLTSNTDTSLLSSDVGISCVAAQSKIQKRKGIASTQSKMCNKTGDLDAGIRTWKKLCIYGPSVEDGVSSAPGISQTTGSKPLKDAVDVKSKLAVSLGTQIVGSRRPFGPTFVPPTLDEAVVFLNQAPNGGLSGGIHKQV